MSTSSISISVTNESNHELLRLRHEVQKGGWSEAGSLLPPSRIPAGGMSTWGTTGSDVAGTSGLAEYRLGRSRATFTVEWDSLRVSPFSSPVDVDASTSTLDVRTTIDQQGDVLAARLRIREISPRSSPLMTAVLRGNWNPAGDGELRDRNKKEAEKAILVRGNSPSPSIAFLDQLLAHKVRAFWRRSSLGFLDVNFQQFSLSYDPGIEQLDYFYSGREERRRLIEAFRHRAATDQIDLSRFQRFVAFPSPPPGPAGATGTDLVLFINSSVEFMQHEVGHLLGLQHPWGFDGELRCSEYHDDFCVMGFTGPRSYLTDPIAVPAPPSQLAVDFWSSGRRASVATIYRYVGDFSNSQRVADFGIGEKVTIAAATSPDPTEPCLAAIAVRGGEVLIEFRKAIDDDRNLEERNPSRDQIVVHSVGLRYLSPSPSGSIKSSTDRPVVFEHAEATIVGADFRLLGMNFRLTSVTTDNVDLVVTTSTSAATSTSLAAVAGPERMDVVFQSKDDFAWRSWTRTSGWRDHWRYPVRWPGGSLAIHQSSDLTQSPIVGIVTIGGAGRPMRAQLREGVDGLGWQRLGAKPTTDEEIATPIFRSNAPSATTRAGAFPFFRTVTVAVDRSGTVQYHVVLTGASAGGEWEFVRGIVASPQSRVAIATRGTNFVDLFVHGLDGRFSHSIGALPGVFSSAITWSPWTVLSPSVFASLPTPTLQSMGANGLVVAFVDSAGVMQAAHWSSAAGWGGLSAVFGAKLRTNQRIAAISRTVDSVDVFALDQTGNVLTNRFQASSGWVGWTPLPSLGVADPAGFCAVTRASNHAEVFVAAAGLPLRLSWLQPNGTWSQWMSLD